MTNEQLKKILNQMSEMARLIEVIGYDIGCPTDDIYNSVMTLEQEVLDYLEESDS